MRISFESRGSFKNTESFLKSMTKMSIMDVLHNAGREGVAALSSETPVDSGLTSQSWDYEVVKHRGGYTISWINTHVEDGANIAILLQYGHGTGTGGYVQGYDYINPAMRPIFDKLANRVWKAVTSA